jgi:hypothetical protein
MLDAATYPHIFDAVLAFAPRAALLRLRGVSKDVRARADALLLPSHLTITASPNGPRIVTGPHGRLPAFAGWALPDALTTPREPDLSSVRVLDIDHAAGLEDVFDHLPEPVTVRFRRAVKHDMASSGITYFAPRQGDVFVLMEPLTALFSAKWRAFPALTGLLERIVINTWSHPRDVVQARRPYIRVGNYTYGAEAVWVFHPETRPRTVTGVHGAIDEAAGRVVVRDEMLRILAAQLVEMLLDDVHITVVNIESLTEGMDEDEVFDWIDPVLAFRSLCTDAPPFDAEQWGAEVSPEERGEIVDHIRFLTMEEYRAEVGDARADIETTWSGRG